MNSTLTEVTMKAIAEVIETMRCVLDNEHVFDDVSRLRVFERVAAALIAEADGYQENVRQIIEAR